jgi:DNA invertase Pin-like site-specific DNA recombinase
MPRAIALLRVSTAAQAGSERGGLPGQRRACDEIARRFDVTIVDTVTLDGVSGVEVLSDPRFGTLLTRLAEPGIDGVVVADFDRLFRRGKWADFGILDAFAESGCVIYTADGAIDPGEESGEWLAGVKTIMSGSERRRLAARTRRGKEERRRLGRRAEGPVGIPLGVSWDKVRGWSYVEPDASRVRAAFAALLSGTHNLREIARLSGLDRGRATNGLSRLVDSVLRQPLYAGEYRPRYRWIRGKRSERPEHERYAVKVLDPPLVSAEDFERAQALLARRPAAHFVRHQRGDLGTYHGFADCARCGAELWMHAAAGHRSPPSYFCGSRRAGRCDQGHAAVTLAEPTIDAALEERLGSEDVLRRLLDRAVEEARTRRAPTSDLGRRMAEIANRRARVQDGHEAGIYSASEAAKRIAALESEYAALAELAGREDVAVPVDGTLVAELVDVFGSWRDLRRSEKRRLLAAYRVRVAVRTTKRKHPPEVESVAIGILGASRDGVRVFKKMRRFGIE